MPRVLFVSSYTGLGGGETSTLELAKALPPDYEPHLLVPADGDFAAAWRDCGWPVYLSSFRGASVYFIPALWAGLRARYAIASIIRRQQIDIVHAEYHTLPFALPAADAAGIPCIWTVMGWWFRPRPWQRAFFRRPAATFAHSQAIKDGFLGNPPFMHPDAIRVLYPGVNLSRFSPRNDGSALRDELGIPQNANVVALIARFQHVKGHDDFVRAAWKIMRRVRNTHFIMAGGNTQSPADQAFREKVLEMINHEPRSGRHFHIIGHRPDVETIMAAADVVVCPSHFESFGVVNVEAMASGIPVVSTNNGGPSEVVVDGVTGFLVPPKDPNALADRVIELLYSEETRRAFGTAGRLRVQQLFSADAAAAAFDETVRSLLAPSEQ